MMVNISAKYMVQKKKRGHRISHRQTYNIMHQHLIFGLQKVDYFEIKVTSRKMEKVSDSWTVGKIR